MVLPLLLSICTLLISFTLTHAASPTILGARWNSAALRIPNNAVSSASSTSSSSFTGVRIEVCFDQELLIDGQPIERIFDVMTRRDRLVVQGRHGESEAQADEEEELEGDSESSNGKILINSATRASASALGYGLTRLQCGHTLRESYPSEWNDEDLMHEEEFMQPFYPILVPTQSQSRSSPSPLASLASLFSRPTIRSNCYSQSFISSSSSSRHSHSSTDLRNCRLRFLAPEQQSWPGGNASRLTNTMDESVEEEIALGKRDKRLRVVAGRGVGEEATPSPHFIFTPKSSASIPSPAAPSAPSLSSSTLLFLETFASLRTLNEITSHQVFEAMVEPITMVSLPTMVKTAADTVGKKITKAVIKTVKPLLLDPLLNPAKAYLKPKAPSGSDPKTDKIVFKDPEGDGSADGGKDEANWQAGQGGTNKGVNTFVEVEEEVDLENEEESEADDDAEHPALPHLRKVLSDMHPPDATPPPSFIESNLFLENTLLHRALTRVQAKHALAATTQSHAALENPHIGAQPTKGQTLPPEKPDGGPIINKAANVLSGSIALQLTVALRRAVEENIMMQTNRTTSRKLSRQLVKRLTVVLTESITRHMLANLSRPIVETTTRLLTHSLTPTLTFALTASIAPSLTRSPHEDYYCYFCKEQSLYCQYCQASREQAYYRDYYRHYYSYYYGNYYRDWYTKDVDLGQFMDETLLDGGKLFEEEEPGEMYLDKRIDPF